MKIQNFQPPTDQTTLVILEQGDVQCYRLDEAAQWSLGRKTPKNNPDIALKSSVVSRCHGTFLLVDDQWFYCDQGSLNGTVYNGKKVRCGLNRRIMPVMLKNGDVLRIDHSSAGKSDPRGVWMLFSTERIPGKWTYFPLTCQSIVSIGRDKNQCDLVQQLPYVSAKHMKLMIRDGNCYVSDCGSETGTWVNGERIDRMVRLFEKDRISICDCNFIFTGTGLIYNNRQ